MDEQTLRSLYLSYGYAVHRRCTRLLGSALDADDVMQEVFMRTMKYGDSFDGRNPLGWLYKISDRQCFDLLRKKKNIHKLEAQLAAEEVQSVLSDTASDREIVALARRITAHADPKDARIALLYYVDGLTQDEVAEEIPCSRKTVKKRLKRFKDLARKIGAEVGLWRRDP